MHKAERTGRIAREPDGQWDIAKTRARLLETILQQHINELLTEASDRTPIAAQCRLQQPFGPK